MHFRVTSMKSPLPSVCWICHSWSAPLSLGGLLFNPVFIGSCFSLPPFCPNFDSAFRGGTFFSSTFVPLSLLQLSSFLLPLISTKLPLFSSSCCSLDWSPLEDGVAYHHFLIFFFFLSLLQVAHKSARGHSLLCSKDLKSKVISVQHLEGGGRQHLGTGTGILLLEAGLCLLSKEDEGFLLFNVEEEGGRRLLLLLLLSDEFDRDCGVNLLFSVTRLLLPNMEQWDQDNLPKIINGVKLHGRGKSSAVGAKGGASGGGKAGDPVQQSIPQSKKKCSQKGFLNPSVPNEVSKKGFLNQRYFPPNFCSWNFATTEQSALKLSSNRIGNLFIRV